jgi:hypothetical protein
VLAIAAHFRQSACVSDGADSVIAYFRDRGLDVRIEQRDLHAEHLARDEAGRASFFVKNRSYHCVNLLRDGAIVAEQYAHGETADDALLRARQRFGSEQG